MINYNNSDVVQCLRQYDMFANSLRLIKTNEERNMIIKQLAKLEDKIIALTNEIYEEEYNTLVNKECGLLDEEKNRLTMLVDLINQRLSYVEKRCNNHYQLTGESIDVAEIAGADTLNALEERIEIIDKYSKNVKLEEELQEEVKSLSSKISLASEKIDINKSLNIELESTFKSVVREAIETLNLEELNESRDQIEYAYYETEKSLTLAESNLEAAKTSPASILSDCEEMLTEVKADYVKYKDQISIIKLMEIYDRNVDNYDELLNKRKEVNDILKYVKNQELLDMILDTVTKQYNTITMEQQDINTFNDLVLEKERKMNALSEINTENNSEEFQSVLKVLIANEKKKQEKLLEEQRKIEEIEKKKRLEVERKKQEEILKRQRIIEEARKKEIEKRTKQLLMEQHNSVLQTKKNEKDVSFDTIKDASVEEDKKDMIMSREVKNRLNFNEIADKNADIELKESVPLFNDKAVGDDIPSNILTSKNDDIVDDNKLDIPIFKDKIDIEKELFEEFNKDNKQEEKVEIKDKFKEIEVPVVEEKQNNDNDTFLDKIESKMSDNKLPDVTFDEYMKTFDESKVEKTQDLFDDSGFPSIPM